MQHWHIYEATLLLAILGLALLTLAPLRSLSMYAMPVLMLVLMRASSDTLMPYTHDT